MKTILSSRAVQTQAAEAEPAGRKTLGLQAEEEVA